MLDWRSSPTIGCRMCQLFTLLLRIVISYPNQEGSNNINNWLLLQLSKPFGKKAVWCISGINKTLLEICCLNPSEFTDYNFSSWGHPEVDDWLPNPAEDHADDKFQSLPHGIKPRTSQFQAQPNISSSLWWKMALPWSYCYSESVDFWVDLLSLGTFKNLMQWNQRETHNFERKRQEHPKTEAHMVWVDSKISVGLDTEFEIVAVWFYPNNILWGCAERTLLSQCVCVVKAGWFWYHKVLKSVWVQTVRLVAPTYCWLMTSCFMYLNQPIKTWVWDQQGGSFARISQIRCLCCCKWAFARYDNE